MNCYLVVHSASGSGFLIDPGAETRKILRWADPVKIERVLLTHGHRDHVGALKEACKALDTTFAMHAADAKQFKLKPGFLLGDGDSLALGTDELHVVHVPGHTPGSIAFRLEDGQGPARVVVGDVVFPGGPGHTTSPEALAQSLGSLAKTVFTWEDDTELHPGHGGSTTVGAERAAFEAFRARPLPPDLHGDVTWR
jgi:glyoxylase-like metal-dependent hydrolase (beta-lactamase superfamily II)